MNACMSGLLFLEEIREFRCCLHIQTLQRTTKKNNYSIGLRRTGKTNLYKGIKSQNSSWQRRLTNSSNVIRCILWHHLCQHGAKNNMMIYPNIVKLRRCENVQILLRWVKFDLLTLEKCNLFESLKVSRDVLKRVKILKFAKSAKLIQFF